jgi:anti-sigma28 factor (negative regulator of flagellin synthesis)
MFLSGNPPHRSAAMSDPRERDLDSVEDLGELESLYSPDYLVECADDEAREERLEELKRRIAQDAYKVDADRIAEEILSRGDLE